MLQYWIPELDMANLVSFSYSPSIASDEQTRTAKIEKIRAERARIRASPHFTDAEKDSILGIGDVDPQLVELERRFAARAKPLLDTSGLKDDLHSFYDSLVNARDHTIQEAQQKADAARVQVDASRAATDAARVQVEAARVQADLQMHRETVSYCCYKCLCRWFL